MLCLGVFSIHSLAGSFKFGAADPDPCMMVGSRSIKSIIRLGFFFRWVNSGYVFPEGRIRISFPESQIMSRIFLKFGSGVLRKAS